VSLSTTSAAIARTHELHAGDAGSNKSVFSLVNSAVNTSLPAFAADRRAAAQLLPGARRSPLSIDTSCPHVGRSAANSIGARRYWRSSDGTGTDGSARDRCTEPAPLTGQSVLVTCTGENVGRPVGPYTSDASPPLGTGKHHLSIEVGVACRTYRADGADFRSQHDLHCLLVVGHRPLQDKKR